MSVTIFAEGGNDSASTTKLRKAFGIFFQKLMPDRETPTVLPCKGRSTTFRQFCKAIKNPTQGHHYFLLVDAEAPIEQGTSAWDHLNNRPGDNWERPDEARDDQVFLMVQCMESWFLADREAVEIWYAHQNFKPLKLPPLIDGSIEPIAKDRVAEGLHAATKDTQASAYHKTRHGPLLLESIEPKKVVAASVHAELMKKALRARSRTKRIKTQ